MADPEPAVWLGVRWRGEAGDTSTRAVSLGGIAEGFAGLGWTVVEVPYANRDAPPRAEAPPGPGAAKATAPAPRSAPPRAQMRTPLLFARAVRARNRSATRAPATPPALVYERYELGGPSLGHLARRHGVPLVVHVHALLGQEGSLRGSVRPGRLARAERRWLQAADALWFVSDETAAFARDVLGVTRAGTVVGNGVGAAFFAARWGESLPERPVVGMSSSFRAHHDHRTVLAATARLVSQGHDVVLDLPGAGPLVADVAEQARRFGIHDRVQFPGWLSAEALAERMARWHVAVAPGTPDGQHRRHLKLLDAAAVGVPIAAADVPANPRTVPAMRFQPGSDVELAEAVAALLDDREFAAALSEAGRAAAGGCRWSAVVERGLAGVFEQAGTP